MIPATERDLIMSLQSVICLHACLFSQGHLIQSTLSDNMALLNGKITQGGVTTQSVECCHLSRDCWSISTSPAHICFIYIWAFRSVTSAPNRIVRCKNTPKHQKFRSRMGADRSSRPTLSGPLRGKQKPMVKVRNLYSDLIKVSNKHFLDWNYCADHTWSGTALEQNRQFFGVSQFLYLATKDAQNICQKQNILHI